MIESWQNYMYSPFSTEIDSKAATVFHEARILLSDRVITFCIYKFLLHLHFYCLGDDKIFTRTGRKPIPM